MIRHDLPALIDYVKGQSKKESTAYVGHSQGNIMMLGLLATKPHYSQFVKPYIALSPVFYSAKFYGPATIVTKLRRLLLKY